MISRILRILFHTGYCNVTTRTLEGFSFPIVTLVAHAPLRFFFTRGSIVAVPSHSPLRFDSSAFDSSAFDYNVIPSLNFRILFHWIVALVSRAHLRFSFIGLLR